MDERMLEIKSKLSNEFLHRPKTEVEYNEIYGAMQYMMEFVEMYQDCTDYLIKIREDLSDVSFQPGTGEYAIASPEGIYEMVMELKGLLKETETNLLAAYNSKRKLELENIRLKAELQGEKWMKESFKRIVSKGI